MIENEEINIMKQLFKNKTRIFFLYKVKNRIIKTGIKKKIAVHFIPETNAIAKIMKLSIYKY
jgi:hypothetical protein